MKWVLTFASINKKCVLKMSGVGIIKGPHRLKHASSRFHETCIRVSLPAFIHRSRATYVAACIMKPRNRCTHRRMFQRVWGPLRECATMDLRWVQSLTKWHANATGIQGESGFSGRYPWKFWSVGWSMVNVEGGASVGGRFISRGRSSSTELPVLALSLLGTPTENTFKYRSTLLLYQ